MVLSSLPSWLFLLILQPTVRHGLQAAAGFYLRMAPPSFLMMLVEHMGSLSCKMSLVPDSPLVNLNLALLSPIS